MNPQEVLAAALRANRPAAGRATAPWDPDAWAAVLIECLNSHGYTIMRVGDG